MLFRPRVWEAAEAIYAEYNRTRRGQAAGICWTLGWVVWSKEMKCLNVPTQVWGEWVQGIRRVGVSGLGEVEDWNERIWGNMRRNTSSEKLEKTTGRPGGLGAKSWEIKILEWRSGKLETGLLSWVCRNTCLWQIGDLGSEGPSPGSFG